MLRIDEERQVIPRWRSYLTTLDHGELHLRLNRPWNQPSVDEHGVNEHINQWRTHPSPSYASELVSVALFVEDPRFAHEAAQSLLASDRVSELAKDIARRVLGLDRHSEDAHVDVLADREDAHVSGTRVRQLRRHLQIDTRNSIGWAELARFHAIGSNKRQARQAMKVAIALAPSNRFILRSAVRMYVHLDEPDAAHRVLSASAATARDPWLVAAEIAVCTLLDRRSRLVKRGREMLDSRRYSERDTAELASALGTVELEADAPKRARRLFGSSLNDPTDNAVAQAVWAGRRLENLEIDQALVELPSSFEARARQFARAGRSREAVDESWGWLYDEPFAVEPPAFGSYQASLAEDYDAGVLIARQGLEANPDDFTLRNNAAFCLAQLDRLDEAQRLFAKVRIHDVPTDAKAAYYATCGLMQYRRGSIEQGRRYYAIALEQSQDATVKALAAIMFAREEVLAGTTLGREAAERALELGIAGTREAGDVPVGDLKLWLSQLYTAASHAGLDLRS
jgi:tetratricopeptide (TPR) repeat protein